MKRVSFATLTLLLPFVAFSAPACSSEDPVDSNTAGTGSTTAGTGNGTAGSGLLPTAGTGNSSGASSGGTGSGTAGTGTAGNGTAGTGTGGAGAGASAGGSAGASSGGTGTAGSAGAATAGAGGGGGTGGAANPNCPAKIDSKVACTAIVTCPDAYCGVFKLGSKDCSCAAASGTFACSSCDYSGKTEEIVLPPASALTACTMDDATLEMTTGCTKGMRCRSTDATKIRFCACWDDPVKGGTAWDCDAMPDAWPL